jgi:release factor glutamine methyltransferase
MKTVLDCMESGTQYLEKRGVEDARNNMQWLMASLLGLSRIELYAQFDRPMSEDELVPLRDQLKRRGEGIPLQHLLGTVEFFRREFGCDGRALVPRPETEELVDLVLKREFPHPARILDMGCGSGVMGLSLAAELAGDCAELVLADLSPEALQLSGENAQRHGLSPTLVESDLFAALEGSFDLIVANLPYVPEGDRSGLSREVAHDPDLALFSGKDGLAAYRRFLPEAAQRLNPDGLLAFEFGIDQAPALGGLCESAGLTTCEFVQDLSGVLRFAFCRPPHS